MESDGTEPERCHPSHCHGHNDREGSAPLAAQVQDGDNHSVRTQRGELMFNFTDRQS